MKRFFAYLGVILFCLICAPLLVIAAVLLTLGVVVALVALIPAALWLESLRKEIQDAEPLITRIEAALAAMRNKGNPGKN